PNIDDPELWLYRYNKSGDMNDWKEDTRLKYVDNCFDQDLQLWYMQENFKNWPQFQEAFMNKFAKKVNFSRIISEFTRFKMMPNEDILEYIKRFELKRAIYNSEIKKRNSINPTKNTKGIDQALDKVNEQGEEIEIMITEAGLLKYFIKGITSTGIKRQIRSEKPKSLEEAYSIIKDIYDSDDSGDETDASTQDDAKITSSTQLKQRDNTNQAPKTKQDETMN
ncbi:hypothetical protein A0J61_11851, partial [Choanephora cucurbitarum]